LKCGKFVKKQHGVLYESSFKTLYPQNKVLQSSDGTSFLPSGALFLLLLSYEAYSIERK
jgi:hypothetical protein